MAEKKINKNVDNVIFVFNNNLAYSTNAEMLSAIANYLGSDGEHSFIKFFSVRCSEAPLSGSAINVIFIGGNQWGGGIGLFNGSSTTLIKIGFANGVGSIAKINQ